MESSSQFNQKVCYVAGKRLFDQVGFAINSDVKPSCRTNVRIISLISEKLNKTDERKLYLTLPGWPTCACSYGKCLSHLGGIPAKLSEIPPKRAGSRLIRRHIFIRVS